MTLIEITAVHAEHLLNKLTLNPQEQNQLSNWFE